ncbi:MAG: hypothetical protein M1815_005619 [Lichina confinis]|nr:MAG: hypothetical protein M1815_005619 [Lichina confinis]
MSPSTSSSSLSSTTPLPEPRPLPTVPSPTRQSTAGTLLLLLALLLAFFPSLFISASRLPFDLVRRSSIFSRPSASGAMSSSSPAAATATAGGWFQTTFTLPPKARGSYLVTSHVESTLGPDIAKYRVGILHLFVQHTSCALSLNENWDEDVRADMSDALDRIVPEAGKASGVSYRHSAEGSDDMPAHIKSALIGPSVSIPISDGRLATGTWQGIWYLEFRAVKHTRRVVATINGERR